MSGLIYEIAIIEKLNGLTEADSARLGRRLKVSTLRVGLPAVLPHADNDEKALVASRVTDVVGVIGDNEIVFSTENSTYKLRKVGE